MKKSARLFVPPPPRHRLAVRRGDGARRRRCSRTGKCAGAASVVTKGTIGRPRLIKYSLEGPGLLTRNLKTAVGTSRGSHTPRSYPAWRQGLVWVLRDAYRPGGRVWWALRVIPTRRMGHVYCPLELLQFPQRTIEQSPQEFGYHTAARVVRLVSRDRTGPRNKNSKHRSRADLDFIPAVDAPPPSRKLDPAAPASSSTRQPKRAYFLRPRRSRERR